MSVESSQQDQSKDKLKEALKWGGMGGVIAGLVILGQAGLILVLSGAGAYSLSKRKMK
jgi:hypothetical protein